MSKLKPNNPINAWSNETVEKIYQMHIDDMHPLDSIKLVHKHDTVEKKRSYLIDVENKFRNSFK